MQCPGPSRSFQRMWENCEFKVAQKSLGKSVPKMVYSGNSSTSSPAGQRGNAKSGWWQNTQAALLKLSDRLPTVRRALPANGYLKKAHSTGSPDLCTLHWSGTRCRMNCLAASLSPVAHRSKTSRTGLSMQFLTIILCILTIMEDTKNRQSLGFLSMKTAREKEPEAMLTWIMSVS